MSAVDRMIAYHIARLQDKNPDVRLRSIQELTLLEAVQALDALEALYRNESDATVRDAARQAGLTLYRLSKSRDSGVESPD